MDQQLEEIEEEEERTLALGGKLTGSMVGRRRVAITHVVGEAWERFSTERVEVVCRAFRIVGLSLPIDGSEDHKISIKGLATDFLCEGLKELEEVGGIGEIGLEEMDEVEGEVEWGEEEGAEGGVEPGIEGGIEGGIKGGMEGGVEGGVEGDMNGRVDGGLEEEMLMEVVDNESIDMKEKEESVDELNFHYD